MNMIYVFDPHFMPLFIVNYIVIMVDIIPDNLFWYVCKRVLVIDLHYALKMFFKTILFFFLFVHSQDYFLVLV